MVDPHHVRVTVYQSPDRSEVLDRALILDAVGLDYQFHRASGEYAIQVRSTDEAEARTELDAYSRENQAWQNPAAAPASQQDGWSGVLIYWNVLLAVALLEHYSVFGCDWLAAGRMNAGSVRMGEWWRTVTALTLHVDFVHLISNLMFGTLFGLFAGQLLGSGLAWFSILLAGAFGNAMNAWIQPAQHSAVGASTALFAALGILSAHAWRRRQKSERRWTRRLVPLVGGVALLAFTGAGGEGTDVMAHLTGFFAGLLLGSVLGSASDRLRFKPGRQLLAGSAAVGLLAFAWFLAL